MSIASNSLDDTIVAPATGGGDAALAIVRLSGPKARMIGAGLAPASAPRLSHRLYRTTLQASDGGVLDYGMVVEMHAPRSYTGEDVVEFHIHGSRVVVSGVVDRCLSAGARLAEPGEFTLRAFLRGRMDLAQAEAVADLIGAANEAQRQVATAHMAGALSVAIASMLGGLEDVLAGWQASLDFPEQVGEVDVRQEEREALVDIHERISTLIGQARLDLDQKRNVVLCGAPNVGKSSLLNFLVGEKRVLVDAAPGTTRDPVEVEVALGATRLSIWDTAGIREDATGLEKQGVELSWERLQRADVPLWLVSVTQPFWPPDGVGNSVVVAGSKADLAGSAQRALIAQGARARGLKFVGFVSVRTREGMASLRAWLAANEPVVPGDVVVVVRKRHLEALKQARGCLERVLEPGNVALTLDLLALEVAEAAKSLGRVVGRDVDGDVLERIFAGFCLGK